MSIPENTPAVPNAPQAGRGRAPGRLARNKSNSAEQTAPNRRQIAVTSFDLLNGSYVVASRSRMFSIVVLSCVLFACLGLGLAGLRSNLTLANVNTEIASLKERQRDATSRFTATTGLPEGVTEKQLIGRFQSLSEAYENMSIQSVSLDDLLASLLNEEVTVTSIEAAITSLPSTGAKDDDATTKKKSLTETDKLLFAGITKLEAGSTLVRVDVTATAESAISLTRWAQRIKELGTFRNMIVTRSGLVYVVSGIIVQDVAPMSTRTSFGLNGLPIDLKGATSTGAAAQDADGTAPGVEGDDQ